MKLPKPLRFLRNIILFFFISTILAVVAYRFVPVYITPLMVIRSVQQVFKGESPRWHHTWVSSDKISPHLPMAVIASEDNRFATHNGFDFIEIQKAIKENETRKRKRGASTISQQTAKNVFLWPQSSWVRKGLEVYFTVLIEFFWSKVSWRSISTPSKWEKASMAHKLPPNTSSRLQQPSSLPDSAH